MPLILRCDHPGCGAESQGDVLQDGRIQAPQGWWILRGAVTVVACSEIHAIGRPTKIAVGAAIKSGAASVGGGAL